MNIYRIARSVAVAAGILLAAPLSFAIKPSWAAKAIAFPSQCEVGSGAPASSGVRTALTRPAARTACKPIWIPSPDRQRTVEIYYGRVEIEKGYDMLVAYFTLHAQDGTTREGSFPTGFQNIDLLWSPDSKAFFVNGGNGGGYWGFWVYVYRVDDPELQPRDIAHQAQLDMLKTFPPCKANQLDHADCLFLEQNPDANMSGIDWAGDSSALIVMAEVPCSGGHGGIMCQVMGYKLDAATGNILGRIPARLFKQDWQRSMAFRFEVPDPPEYCDKGNPGKIPGCIGHDW